MTNPNSDQDNPKEHADIIAIVGLMLLAFIASTAWYLYNTNQNSPTVVERVKKIESPLALSNATTYRAPTTTAVPNAPSTSAPATTTAPATNADAYRNQTGTSPAGRTKTNPNDINTQTNRNNAIDNTNDNMNMNNTNRNINPNTNMVQ